MAIRKGYLFDTNIFLEILLKQDSSEISKNLLNHKSLNVIYISDFTIHSIGVVLNRKSNIKYFDLFIDDLIKSNKFKMLSISLNQMYQISENSTKYRLDFDDAYQMTLCEIYNLQIVTFDQDFNTNNIDFIHPIDLYNTLN